MAVVALGDGEPLEGGWVAICNSIPDCREGWNPDSRGWIPDSRGWIPDSKRLDSGFQRQKYVGFLIPDSLTWGDRPLFLKFN